VLRSIGDSVTTMQHREKDMCVTCKMFRIVCKSKSCLLASTSLHAEGATSVCSFRLEQSPFECACATSLFVLAYGKFSVHCQGIYSTLHMRSLRRSYVNKHKLQKSSSFEPTFRCTCRTLCHYAIHPDNTSTVYLHSTTHSAH
jgi:hypothetical protein